MMVLADLEPGDGMDIRPFQRTFLRRALAPDIDTAALSLPRGNGKSWLAAYIAARALLTIRAHREIALAAASIEQGRIVYRWVREFLAGRSEFRYLDSATRCAITRNDGARLRVIGSNGKTAMGLVSTPIVIADEPGSWEQRGGELLFDAIQTAQGKPGSRLKAIYIGTLAPMATGPGHWWWDLVNGGSHGSAYVQVLQGDPQTWDSWPTIRKANPLTMVSADFRRKLLEERDAARADPRLKARFLSYRLNRPAADESSVLLRVEDWERVCARAVPAPDGRPIVGIDLGGGRAWSAAVAVWESGRMEAQAVAPGVPSLEDQERRDRVPAGTYRKLELGGALGVAEDLRVPPPSQLVEAVCDRWGRPAMIVCDRFRLAELQDAAPRLRIEPRVSRWSEAAADIRALRRMAMDGPLACHRPSRQLLTVSLSGATVKSDDQGSVRLVKVGDARNTARDDVAAAAVLAAGAWERRPKRQGRGVYRGSTRAA